ncbi:MAG: hypothetical protein LC127_03725 [Chitinophagales bacterium]|nr:hypothetical protein [Chitinophagales bacterium]
MTTMILISVMINIIIRPFRYFS